MLVLVLPLIFAHRPRLAFENLAMEPGSTNHLPGLVLSDHHDSLCRLPDSSGRQGTQAAAHMGWMSEKDSPLPAEGRRFLLPSPFVEPSSGSRQGVSLLE